MSALGDYLVRRGAGFENRLKAWSEVFRFAGVALRGVCARSTYNSATREVVLRQIYFTAWQIIGGYVLFVAIFSLVVTHILAVAARRYGVYEYALEFTLRALVLEVVPLLTALFVALRTGAAISTEVSLMRIRNEIGALERAGIDPVRLELIPRVIGGTFSVLSLTATGVAVSVLCAHFVVTGYRPWSAPSADLRAVVGTVFDGVTMTLLWSKTLLFGLAVTVIPIAESMSAPRKIFFAPIAVLHGMVRLFFAVMLIEVVALVILYA
ncbi:MAG: ABC transporter permease [Betaproteobacteria bacterium]|nr:ABC transporter permease [Betaproteobacteria bacterium]